MKTLLLFLILGSGSLRFIYQGNDLNGTRYTIQVFGWVYNSKEAAIDDAEREEARAKTKAVHPTTYRRAGPVFKGRWPTNVKSGKPPYRYPVPLPDLRPELGVRLRQQGGVL